MKKEAGFYKKMKNLIKLLVLVLVLSAIAGCSTIKGYISPSAATTKKNNPTKQYCVVLQKMVKAGKGVSQIGPGTAIVDATSALKRMGDAYSDLEKFGSNNPDFKTDEAAGAYQTFKQAVPTLGSEGNVGDPAIQIRAALDAYNKTMNDLVATACPSK
jgi:predicted small lipoprotein YifL